MTDSWEDHLWTDATRTTYLEAGEAAIEALRSHLSLVAATSSDADEPRIDDSAETVRLAFLALSDAEFNFSSTLAPFSLLELDEDDDDDDHDHEHTDGPDVSHDKISIMVRRDFRLTSESDLIAAGRTAYSKISPDEAPELPEEDVDDLGRALYQIVHAGGIDALSATAGIEPVTGVILALGRDELMAADDLDDLLEDPAEIFAGEGEILYSLAEVWSD
jgi:hypothetical protein